MRLVAYVRVSTNGQAIQGDSPAMQDEACRAWASANGHEVVAVLADNGLSGKLDVKDRPGLASALVEIKDGRADGLLVYSLDRLARELHVQEAVLAQVWAAGGRAFEATHGEVLPDDPDDPMRTFLRQVMGAASQLEASMIKARLRRGRRRKAQRGGYVGGSLRHRKYGSTLVRGEDGKYAWRPVPTEQTTIQRIGQLRAAGKTGAAIARLLDAEGVTPPSGPQWHGVTVMRIAKREAMAVAA